MIKDKEERKKVIVVLLSYSNFTGGIQKYNRDLIDSLRKFSQIGNIEAIDLYGYGSKTSSVKSFSGNKFLFTCKLVKSFMDADIVIWAHPFFLFFIPILSIFQWMAGRHKKTHVLEIYGTDITGYSMNFLSRQGLRACNAIISCSKRTANALMAKYRFVNANKITVINPAIPRVVEPVEMQYTALSSRRLKILTVGRVEPYKLASIQRLIGAVELMNDQNISVEFNIVGSGSCMKELHELVANAKIPHLKINVHGYVNDLQEHYCAADLFFLVNKYEGFGIVYLEAMAHGVPCIAAKNSGACEAIIHDETGFLIDDEDSELEIKRYLDSFISSDELRKRMKENARNHAADFNMETFKVSLQRVFQL